MQLTNTFVLLSTFIAASHAFPQYRSLAGLSHEEVERMSANFAQTPGAQPLPGPLKDDSMKLVHDENHQWMPLREGDIRGPCPGLNTLASHGYLDRSGIATPGQIIEASQEGFNMDNQLASFVTYAAFLVNGNQLTNLVSIGGESQNTGPPPPKPASVGGFSAHAMFEGDASTTRQDDFFGDNHSFNEGLFQELIDAAHEVGNGTYNPTSAALIRHRRIEHSKARNPQFILSGLRFLTVFAESVFPFAFFVDGRKNSTSLGLEDARSFFEHSRFPKDFHRREGAFMGLGKAVGGLFAAFPKEPGVNQGEGNFIVDKNDPGLSGGFCYSYHKQTELVKRLYPDPMGDLKTALKGNLETFYKALAEPDCQQDFPYGI